MRAVRAISAALIIMLFVPHLHAQDLHAGSYKDGQQDRILWELWFNSLKGKHLAGARYWVNHHIIPKTRSCADADIDGSYAWQGGCNEARRRLAASDQRGKLDPEYRRGWDAPKSPDPPEPPSDNAVIVPSPADAVAPEPESIEVDQTQDTSENVLPIAPTPPPETIITHSSGIVNEITYDTIVGFLVLGFLLYLGCRWYYRVKSYRLVIAGIKAETEKYADILAKKRRDTLIPDEFGTSRFHEWDQEKILFTRAQILPILRIEHVEKFYDKLSLEIDDIIERTAAESEFERTFTIPQQARKLFEKHIKGVLIKKRA